MVGEESEEARLLGKSSVSCYPLHSSTRVDLLASLLFCLMNPCSAFLRSLLGFPYRAERTAHRIVHHISLGSQENFRLQGPGLIFCFRRGC